MGKKAYIFGKEWDTVTMSVSEAEHAEIEAWLKASYSFGEDYYFGRTGTVDFNDDTGEKYHEYNYYFTNSGMATMMSIKFPKLTHTSEND